MFLRNLTLQEASLNRRTDIRKAKRTEFDCAACKKFKLLIDRWFKFDILSETECFSKFLLSLQSYKILLVDLPRPSNIV